MPASLSREEKNASLHRRVHPCGGDVGSPV